MNDINEMPPKCQYCPYWEVCEYPWVCPDREQLATKLQPTCNQLATDTISRQAAIDAFYKGPKRTTRDVLAEIKTLPPAQPEIIKCKDCLHWVRTCGDNQWGLGDCDVFDKHLVMCEGYCAWAERRSDG